MDERKKEIDNQSDKADKSNFLANERIGGSKVGGKIEITGQGKFVGGNHYETHGVEVKDLPELIKKLSKSIKESVLDDPENFQKILMEYHSIQDEIQEWKELHNHLDSTIQAYSQFQHEVRRLSQASPNVSDLFISWQKINAYLDLLLEWARTIKHIGKKYQDDGGVLNGELWAIKLETTRRKILKHLYDGQEKFERSNSILSSMFGNHDSKTWCDDLRNLESEYYSTVLTYMHDADDKLRVRIGTLIEVSNKFFVR